mmetsp:Transcript_18258/g.52075  ORF Transcript_18258/g.52075 Transcript_18258/m.52075 type:complete len:186 (+) Transcript_18258:319-876(+)
MHEAGFKFDLAYTYVLKRAIKILWIVLEELDCMYIPIVRRWRLNEHHYGALQGLNKQETVDKHSKDQVLIWRRSYDIPPPEIDESSEHFPGNNGDPRHADVPNEDLPKAESLKLTEEQFMVEWEQELIAAIQPGKSISSSSSPRTETRCAPWSSIWMGFRKMTSSVVSTSPLAFRWCTIWTKIPP